MSLYIFGSPCHFTATSGSDLLGDFVVVAAVAGFNTPENLQVVNGKMYEYLAQNVDGTIYERGKGAYSTVTHSIARTIILDTSGITLDKVPIVDPTVIIFQAPSSSLESSSFPSGTAMLFQQTTAPVGWTKQTTHNDKALRIVSGTVGSGGTNSFSSMFAARTTDGHSTSVGEMPSHGHTYTGVDSGAGGGVGGFQVNNDGNSYGSINSTTAGGGGAHSHTYDMRVQYVDSIIATKD